MTKASETDRGEQLFRKIRQRFQDDPDVNEGTGFGKTPGLRVGTKIFAMLSRGELVVKLPKDRVDELVAAGIGARFDPRRDGRLMREWATIPVGSGREWGRLADEAHRFVTSA
jgi:hypothetical protein